LQAENTEITFYFSAMDESQQRKFHPYNAPQSYFTFFAYDTVVNAVEPPEFPATFVLYQNYPNPFNNHTMINFDILTPSEVKLTIYNLKGQVVKELVNETLVQGSYRKIWDGKNEKNFIVASGTYLINCEVGDYVETKKMLILR